VNVPSDLKYTSTHEWVRVEGDIATIGVTDYAQSELGDIVYVDLPSPGRALRAEESFGSVESVKTVSDVYAPLAGEVTEVNEALSSQSELLNTDPYGQGWLLKMRLADPSQVEQLLDPDTYRASIEH
jgi:glycine cleavage system H protein